MRRFVALVITGALSLSAAPLFAARVTQAQGASLAGTATSNAGQTLANVTVQLRDLATGQLVGTTTSSATGAFSFTGLAAGSYTVEVINAAGQIVGASAAAIGAAAGGAAAAAAGAAAAGAGAAAGISTAVIVTTVAAAAGVTGAVVVANTASASR